MRWWDGITDSMGVSLSKDNEGQRSLACCSPRGCKESDTIEQLNNNHTNKDAARNTLSFLTAHLEELL